MSPGPFDIAIAEAIEDVGDVREGEEGLKAESGNGIDPVVKEFGSCIGRSASGEVWRELFV
jgi:hypothetical protein